MEMVGCALAPRPLRRLWPRTRESTLRAETKKKDAAWFALGAPTAARVQVGFRLLVRATGNSFHQRHHLVPYGLIPDLAIGPQQPEAERAVEKQQALDFLGFTVAIVEERHGHIERRRNLLQAGCADAIDAFLVFLNLLEAYSQPRAEIRLRDPLFDAPQTDLPPHLNFGFSRTARFHFRRFVHCRDASLSGFDEGTEQ
jgi:hypothetical protein